MRFSLVLALAAVSVGCVRVPKIAAREHSAATLASNEQTLRVMTLNIAHATKVPQVGGFVRESTRVELLEAMGTLIRNESPAIVAMQEVHRPLDGAKGLHHLEMIQKASGYADGHFGEHLIGPAMRRHQGTALLSAYALESKASGVLSLEAGDDKGFVKATMRVPQWLGRSVDVYSVHLDPFSEKKRLTQVQMLADALRRSANPTIVMGDFNARYQGPRYAIGRLLALTNLRAHDLRGGEPTFPAPWPRNRIDWILISPELEFVSHRNVNAGVSDHQGIIAELKLRDAGMQMATVGGGELAPNAAR